MNIQADANSLRTPVVHRNEDGTATLFIPEPPEREYPVSTELLQEWAECFNENVRIKAAANDVCSHFFAKGCPDNDGARLLTVLLKTLGATGR